jgi:hypothetical protein
LELLHKRAIYETSLIRVDHMNERRKDATQPDAPSGAPVSIVDDALGRHLAAIIVLRGGREAAIVAATGIPGLCGPLQGDTIN